MKVRLTNPIILFSEELKIVVVWPSLEWRTWQSHFSWKYIFFEWQNGLWCWEIPKNTKHNVIFESLQCVEDDCDCKWFHFTAHLLSVLLQKWIHFCNTFITCKAAFTPNLMLQQKLNFNWTQCGDDFHHRLVVPEIEFVSRCGSQPSVLAIRSKQQTANYRTGLLYWCPLTLMCEQAVICSSLGLFWRFFKLKLQ